MGKQILPEIVEELLDKCRALAPPRAEADAAEEYDTSSYADVGEKKLAAEALRKAANLCPVFVGQMLRRASDDNELSVALNTLDWMLGKKGKRNEAMLKLRLAIQEEALSAFEEIDWSVFSARTILANVWTGVPSHLSSMPGTLAKRALLVFERIPSPDDLPEDTGDDEQGWYHTWRGLAAYNAGDYILAVQELEQANEESPLGTCVQLADSYIRLGDYESALSIHLCDDGKLQRGSYEDCAGTGRCYIGMKRWAEAEDAFFNYALPALDMEWYASLPSSERERRRAECLNWAGYAAARREFADGTPSVDATARLASVFQTARNAWLTSPGRTKIKAEIAAGVLHPLWKMAGYAMGLLDIARDSSEMLTRMTEEHEKLQSDYREMASLQTRLVQEAREAGYGPHVSVNQISDLVGQVELAVRSLVICAYKKKYGSAWLEMLRSALPIEELGKVEQRRQRENARPEDIVHYLDPSPLKRIVSDRWDLVAPFFLDPDRKSACISLDVWIRARTLAAHNRPEHLWSRMERLRDFLACNDLLKSINQDLLTYDRTSERQSLDDS